jgi:hypothetical protein
MHIKATASDRVDERKIKSLSEQLPKFDPDQIKQFAAERAKISIERRKGDANVLFRML